MKVSFVIPGPPKGKGRPRVERHGGFTKTRTPEDTAIYENLVKTVYYQQCRNQKFDSKMALDVRIYAYYPIPESESKRRKGKMLDQDIRPTKKPDFDNVGKIITDALNKIAYHDDSQIVDFQFRKFFSNNPRVLVVIQEAMPINAAVE